VALPPSDCDVIVIGSGAAGLFASVRAHDLGLTTAVFEKSSRYGGTSAVSGGGVWLPNNPDIANHDTLEKAQTYLNACTRGDASDAHLKAFLQAAPQLVSYLREQVGVPLTSIAPMPDYQSRLPGSIRGRAMAPGELDGALLGEDYFRLREPYSYLQLFGRISINNVEAGQIGGRLPGWHGVLLRLLKNYWLDFKWRARTTRDRRLTNGQALVGHLRLAMLKRRIPLILNTGLVGLIRGAAGVSGVILEREGRRFEVRATKAVILAAGGFEQSQVMRERYLRNPGTTASSATPRPNNTGDAILAGIEIGAAVALMEAAWKAPVIRVPSQKEPNTEITLPLFWDRGNPGSVCVNRLGRRFVDEAVSYDEFVAAMITDNNRTGANLPCWMIFDATHRKNYLAGPLLPGNVKPDHKLPPDWQDSVYYKADSIGELAKKISIDVSGLIETVGKMNQYARSGVDTEFDRGGSVYDKFWADPKVKPNGNLGAIEIPPFYALRLEQGDLGTKGGLKTDPAGRVLDQNDRIIAGLYAAGNCAASIFADSYPGAGGTLGPALSFAFLAAEDIGSNSRH
jgi:3-oxosteroid 1-dehydrogenase